MILHMHDDKTQGEEWLSPPAENKQMGAPLEEQPEPTPASPLRWKGVLLSILGIALPCVGGFLIGWPWQYGDSLDILFMGLGVGLSVVVGAALLRSWWAITIVPVVCIAGGILARFIVSPLVLVGSYSSVWSNVPSGFDTGVIWWGLYILASYYVLLLFPATFGAKIGVFYRGSLSNWLQQRRYQR